MNSEDYGTSPACPGSEGNSAGIHPGDQGMSSLPKCMDGTSVVLTSLCDLIAFGTIQSPGRRFSATRGMYVDTKANWFSDRTVCSASSKIRHWFDTSFSMKTIQWVGLVFGTLDEAIKRGAGIAVGSCSKNRKSFAEDIFRLERKLRALGLHFNLE